MFRDEKDLKVPFFNKWKYTIFLLSPSSEQRGLYTRTVGNSSLSSGFWKLLRAWLSSTSWYSVHVPNCSPVFLLLTESLETARSLCSASTSTWFFYIVKPAIMENELLLQINGMCTFFSFCGLGKINCSQVLVLGNFVTVAFKCGLKVVQVWWNT